MRSDFGLLGCMPNIDSSGNRLAECTVQFIYIQYRAVRGCLFGDGRRTDKLWVLTVWKLFAIACTSKETIANLMGWLFRWCNCRRNAFADDHNPSGSFVGRTSPRRNTNTNWFYCFILVMVIQACQQSRVFCFPSSMACRCLAIKPPRSYQQINTKCSI